MPNWCFQDLTVYGKSEQEVKLFLEAIKVKGTVEELSLNQLLPMPSCLEGSTSGFFSDEEKQKELEEQAKKNREECGYANWYDWANDVWGTKWGACDVESLDDYGVHDGHVALLKFESAWSPAVGLIRGISSKFPTLVFCLSYTEESDAFAGVEVFVQGFCEGEIGFEPEDSDLPDIDDVGEDEYYRAWDAHRENVMTKVDNYADEFLEDAKKAIPVT